MFNNIKLLSKYVSLQFKYNKLLYKYNYLKSLVDDDFKDLI